MLDKTSPSLRLIELASAAAPQLAAVQGDPASANLHEAGLSSIAAVRLMLEIEAAFDVSIPDGDLTPDNFATVASIEQLLGRLKTSAHG